MLHLPRSFSGALVAALAGAAASVGRLGVVALAVTSTGLSETTSQAQDQAPVIETTDRVLWSFPPRRDDQGGRPDYRIIDGLGLLPDGSVLITGIDERDQRLLVRVDGSGRELWRRFLSGELYGSSFSDPAVVVLAGGEGDEPAGSEFAADAVAADENNGFWGVRTSDGRLLWRREWWEAGLDIGDTLAAGPDGSFLVGGYESLERGSQCDNRAAVVRLDATGRVLWRWGFVLAGFNRMSFVNDILPLPDGRTLVWVGSLGKHYVGRVACADYSDRAWLIWLDEAGRQQALVELPPMGSRQSMTILPDGAIGLAGLRYENGEFGDVFVGILSADGRRVLLDRSYDFAEVADLRGMGGGWPRAIAWAAGRLFLFVEFVCVEDDCEEVTSRAFGLGQDGKFLGAPFPYDGFRFQFLPHGQSIIETDGVRVIRREPG
jgi:hypothetical protein